MVENKTGVVNVVPVAIGVPPDAVAYQFHAVAPLRLPETTLSTAVSPEQIVALVTEGAVGSWQVVPFNVTFGTLEPISNPPVPPTAVAPYP